MARSSDKAAKIIAYEQFVNETLKEDLRNVLEQRDKVYSQIAEYSQLKSVIERIKDSDCKDEPLKTQVDLGCNFYVQAKVPDSSRIYVCVGYGFYVEFTLEEATKFICVKTEHLYKSADVLTKDAAKIKAHIKLVLEGLREIQSLNVTEHKQYRDVLS